MSRDGGGDGARMRQESETGQKENEARKEVEKQNKVYGHCQR